MFKGSSYDDYDNQRYSEFDDRYVRHAFLRKVYTILSIQLLFALGVICLFIFVDEVQTWAMEHKYLMWVAMGAMLVTMIPIACCESVRRNYPINYILLILFTIASSFMLGFTSALHAPNTVLYAIGITAAVVVVLTIFAMQTSIDFTACGGILLAALVVLIIFGIVVIFIPSKTLILIYASIGVIIFSIYLVYDTQLMIGGNHKYSISPEDYVFAALTLYMDVINIFMYILTILGIVQE